MRQNGHAVALAVGGVQGRKGVLEEAIEIVGILALASEENARDGLDAVVATPAEPLVEAVYLVELVERGLAVGERGGGNAGIGHPDAGSLLDKCDIIVLHGWFSFWFVVSLHRATVQIISNRKTIVN